MTHHFQFVSKRIFRDQAAERMLLGYSKVVTVGKHSFFHWVVGISFTTKPHHLAQGMAIAIRRSCVLHRHLVHGDGGSYPHTARIPVAKAVVGDIEPYDKANRSKQHGGNASTQLYKAGGLLLQRTIPLRRGGNIHADFAVFGNRPDFVHRKNSIRKSNFSHIQKHIVKTLNLQIITN